MTLATRCNSCGTAFRVVRDQLRISEGWVRCGQCQEVFNALESLFDLESGLPPPRLEERPALPIDAAGKTDSTPLTSAHAEPVADPARVPEPQSDLPIESTQEPSGLQPSPTERLDRPADGEGLDVDLTGVGVAEALEPMDARARVEPIWEDPVVPVADEREATETEVAATWKREVSSEHALPDLGDGTPSAAAPSAPHFTDEAVVAARTTDSINVSHVQEPRAEATGTAFTEPEEREVPMPAFLQQASPAADRHPARRGLGILLVCVLLLAATGQAVFLWRETLATRWPESRPVLAAACASLGCKLEPWRHLAGLRVESSSLGQVGTTTIYQLSVTLRNETPWPLRTPALELTLTDPQGRITARRVLTAADLGSSDPSIAARGELVLQASLNTGDRRISGYTLELFHP
jgi:predicted Zn finger-like uncharacterized protein